MIRASAPATSARRLRRRGAWLIAGLILLGVIVADQSGWLLVRVSDDIASYHGRVARVTRVIDGDTLDVLIPDSLAQSPVTRVRLWGVNAPEPARRASGAAAEPLAMKALDATAALVLNRDVTLWLESHQTRDQFGAVLAHIELPDRTCVNESLLETGLARVDERWPHRRLTRYAQLQWHAKRAAIGVWETGIVSP